jgi:parallel beta-helix repeat protein
VSLLPAAFLSYARLDDRHEGGRLTEFCRRLSGAVSIHIGEEFDIFQDRNDIQWGEQWQQRIEKSLDSTTFLIPILTPGFFKSTYCYKELERFLDREKQLGLSDLILSVYYVDCPILSDKGKLETDLVVKTLASRQYADWREFRFMPLTSLQVRKTLDNLGQRIARLQERGPGKPLPAGPGGSAVQDTPGAEGSKPIGPAHKAEPPTHVVDPIGDEHATVAHALRNAKSGDRILIRPGLYKENLVIEKPVEIIGDGELGDVVIEASGKPTVLFQASMARLANLALRQAGGENAFCVDIAQGRLDLEGCDITSQSLACVAIHDGADPWLRSNRIHSGKEGGIFVYRNGQGTLEDNDIFDNGLAGIEIQEGGNPTLRRNRIRDGKEGGVYVHKSGEGVFEDNEISANRLAGVAIMDGGNPVLRHNSIHDGKVNGIYVAEGGQGLLEDNDIFANAFSGVEIKEGGNPTLRQNRIHHGKAGGVMILANGRGVLEDNDISANAEAGATIWGGANPILRRNRISQNGHAAIRVHDGGRGILEDNDLRGNAGGAWEIAPDCLDNIIRNGNQE